ncbi:hypothetical protein OAU50_01990, partial [Planctomycetota bacterium]|nr:hypothetical protein [Planctomycetota bacterium]
MKGPQLAAVLWVANVAVLGGGGFLGYKVFTGVSSDRSTAHSAVLEYTRKKTPEREWDKTGLTIDNLDLKKDGFSPYKRPAKEVITKPDDPIVTPPPPPPPSVEEQFDETAKWAAQQFSIERLRYSSLTYLASAIITVKDTGSLELMVWPELNFKKNWGRDAEGEWLVTDPNLQKLSIHDITIKAIEPLALVLDVPNKHPSP